MAGRLEGKVALVTGAGSVGGGWGNGRATAVRFAEEGATVFAVDKDVDALERTRQQAEKAGLTLYTCQCDVMNSEAVSQMVADCTRRFSRLDVLVNNVGGSARGGPEELSEEDWNRQLDFNLKSVYLTCRHALPYLKRSGQSAIVNTASTSASDGLALPRSAMLQPNRGLYS